MLKLNIRIKEESEDNVSVKIKEISEKDFNNSSQAEKITASEIKTAIEYAIDDLRKKMRKEEK